MFKVINGNRSALEALTLETIWLGDPKDAEQLISRLQRPSRQPFTLIIKRSEHSTAQLFPVPETE